MVTLAFLCHPITFFDAREGRVVNQERDKTYDIITFDDEKDAARYMLFTGSKPVMNPQSIDPKKDHFNFSHWSSKDVYLNAEHIAQMKDL